MVKVVTKWVKGKWMCINKGYLYVEGYVYELGKSEMSSISGPLAQLAERLSHNPYVVSSILTRSTISLIHHWNLGLPFDNKNLS